MLSNLLASFWLFFTKLPRFNRGWRRVAVILFVLLGPTLAYWSSLDRQAYATVPVKTLRHPLHPQNLVGDDAWSLDAFLFEVDHPNKKVLLADWTAHPPTLGSDASSLFRDLRWLYKNKSKAEYPFLKWFENNKPGFKQPNEIEELIRQSYPIDASELTNFDKAVSKLRCIRGSELVYEKTQDAKGFGDTVKFYIICTPFDSNIHAVAYAALFSTVPFLIFFGLSALIMAGSRLAMWVYVGFRNS